MVNTQTPEREIEKSACGSNGQCTGKCRCARIEPTAPPIPLPETDRRSFLSTAVKTGLVLSLPASGLLTRRAAAAAIPSPPLGPTPMRSPAHHQKFAQSRAAESDGESTVSPPPLAVIAQMIKIQVGLRVVTLRVDVAEFGEVGYQWQKDGVGIVEVYDQNRIAP